jgi:hypothetical protein
MAALLISSYIFLTFYLIFLILAAANAVQPLDKLLTDNQSMCQGGRMQAICVAMTT